MLRGKHKISWRNSHKQIFTDQHLISLLSDYFKVVRLLAVKLHSVQAAYSEGAPGAEVDTSKFSLLQTSFTSTVNPVDRDAANVISLTASVVDHPTFSSKVVALAVAQYSRDAVFARQGLPAPRVRVGFSSKRQSSARLVLPTAADALMRLLARSAISCTT